MTHLRLGWFLATTGLFLACGGSVENGGTGGGGAQAGSGGGGAQAGSGGGGTGATGAYGGGGMGAYGGGGMGGMAAMGGMGAYGGGGMGAYGGGGMGAMGGVGGSGGDLNQKAAAVCQAMQSLPCNLPDCKSQLSQAIQASLNAGCGDVFGAVLDCALAYPLICDNQGQPQLAPECDPVLQKFQSCVSPGQCQTWGDSSGGCGEDCSYWGVACKPVPNGMACTCTMGPAGGKTFQIPATCNSPGWDQAVSSFCS